MWEYDGGYFPDASPISNLPEGTFRRFTFFILVCSPHSNLSAGIPSALSQQMSALVGDYFYATLDIQPQKATRSNDDGQWSATCVRSCHPKLYLLLCFD